MTTAKRKSNYETARQALGVETLEDATEPITIRIIQEDIDNAVPSSPTECVAALCIKQSLRAEQAFIWRGTSWVRIGDKGYRYANSKQLRDHVIYALDEGREAKPGIYHLLPPPKAMRLGEPEKRRKALQEKRARGEAPPPTRRQYKPRKLVTRINTFTTT